MIVLNHMQSIIAAEASRMIRSRSRSSSNLYQFSGAAGTGKSVVLRAIMEQSGLSDEEVLALAPTGQAAIVMRTKGFPYATTIHSALFRKESYIIKDENGNDIIDEQFNTPKIGLRFKAKNKKDIIDSGIKAIFIDEARMVSEYLANSIMNLGLPVIATGDINQLDPVKAKPYFINSPDIPMLNELMRQAEQSPIVYLAHRALNKLPIQEGLYGNQVLVLNREDVNEDMIYNANIILCSTNRTRDTLNNSIRKSRLGRDCSTPPIAGDRVICRKNNWGIDIGGIALCNGMVGDVIQSYPTNVSGVFDMKFAPDINNSINFNIHCDSNYISSDFNKRNYLKNSGYTKENLFEYAYASTIHLSQGSEYSNGIMIEEQPFGADHNKLLYTGITRFRQTLIYVLRKKTKYFTR